MFLSVPKIATLKKYRDSGVYDDEVTTTETIKVCQYNVDMAIRFGIVSVPNATGYFITQNIDAKEGDQIVCDGHTYTILKVSDRWQFNKIVNMEIAVK
jgi:hypothetical protein